MKLEDNIINEIKPNEIKPNVTHNETRFISSNFALSSQIIKDLEAEEIRLQEILDNIKLLKDTQKRCLENINININNTNTNTNTPIVVFPTTSIKKSTEIVSEKSNVLSQPTFASKVKNSLKN